MLRKILSWPLISVVFLSACGAEYSSVYKPALPEYEGFEAYVEKFVDEAEERNVLVDLTGLKVRYSITPLQNETSHVIGTCTVYSNDTKIIEIDKAFWEKAIDEFTKESLMFHELGHCILKRDHKNELLDINIPSSLMRSELVSGYLLSIHYDLYLDELFLSE